MSVNQRENLTLDQESFRAFFYASLQEFFCILLSVQQTDDFHLIYTLKTFLSCTLLSTHQEKNTPAYQIPYRHRV